MSGQINFQVVPLAELASEGIAPQIDLPKSIVLVVDDEVVIADTLVAILKQNGLLAMAAYNGQAALDSARLIPPDLLLTDVIMPDMNGIDLAIAVTEVAPDCKILLFSGQAGTMDLLASARDSGHDFSIIAKPIHPTELLVQVSASLQSQSAAYASPMSNPHLMPPLLRVIGTD